MNLRAYIEQGEEFQGTLRALGEYLGQAATVLSDAKAGKRGLPSIACVKLAQLLGVDPTTVIAASELVTEKKEDRRAFWLPFVLKSNAKGAKKHAHHVP